MKEMAPGVEFWRVCGRPEILMFGQKRRMCNTFIDFELAQRNATQLRRLRFCSERGRAGLMET